MKKIAANSNNSEINLDDIELRPHNVVAFKPYRNSSGFVLVNTGDKAGGQQGTTFKWRCVNDLIFGYNGIKYDTLKEAIKVRLDEGQDVFLFDNFKSFLDWSKN